MYNDAKTSRQRCSSGVATRRDGSNMTYAERWIDAFNEGTTRHVSEFYSPNVRWEERPSTLHPHGQAGDLAAAVAAVTRRIELLRPPKARLRRALTAGTVQVIEYAWEATVRSSNMFADGHVIRVEAVGIHELDEDGLAAQVTEYVVVIPSGDQ